jgi:hypothetical protein
LSVIFRSGKLQFDSCAGWKLHYLEGASRIWAGILSGVIVALAIQTEVFLAIFNHGDHKSAVTMLAALAAGSSERLAGSIISKFESTEAKIGSTADGKEADAARNS